MLVRPEMFTYLDRLHEQVEALPGDPITGIKWSRLESNAAPSRPLLPDTLVEIAGIKGPGDSRKRTNRVSMKR